MSVTHEIQVTKTATPALVQAEEPVPGLRVYIYPEELRKAGEYYIWRLGHHSGLQIAKFEQRTEAEAAAEMIAPLTDWTRSSAELRATEGLGDQVAVRITYDTVGVLSLNPKPVAA
ncbi:hypothetical protein [Streptomyces hirsutus]|uniref:hypothetical protein n=1 Tax=Streptomyces hirsutus TaxID=35620 RepID=UPI0036B3ABBB